MLLLLLSLEFCPCCAVGVVSLDCISFEFRDKPGDDTMETLSRESPSDKRLAVVLLCFNHMAYVLNSGFTSAYVWVSDKLPSFILAEFLLAILGGGLWSLWNEQEMWWKVTTNLCWKTCMSSAPFGRLWVPEPKRSLTDWLSCAADGPVNEKLLYCALCCCISKKAKNFPSSIILKLDKLKLVTLLEVGRCGLRSAWNL